MCVIGNRKLLRLAVRVVKPQGPFRRQGMRRSEIGLRSRRCRIKQRDNRFGCVVRPELL